MFCGKQFKTICVRKREEKKTLKTAGIWKFEISVCRWQINSVANNLIHVTILLLLLFLSSISLLPYPFRFFFLFFHYLLCFINSLNGNHFRMSCCNGNNIQLKVIIFNTTRFVGIKTMTTNDTIQIQLQLLHTHTPTHTDTDTNTLAYRNAKVVVTVVLWPQSYFR